MQGVILRRGQGQALQPITFHRSKAWLPFWQRSSERVMAR